MPHPVFHQIPTRGSQEVTINKIKLLIVIGPCGPFERRSDLSARIWTFWILGHDTIPITGWSSSWIRAMTLGEFHSLFSILTDLLRWHLYTLKFAHCKCTVHWILVNLWTYTTFMHYSVRTFAIPPKETSCPFAVIPCSIPSLRQSPICFLSL